MRSRALALLLTAAAVAGTATPADAHPMGNISISHYAGIEIHRDSVVVKYLLDFAEIPSFRELSLVDPDNDNQVTPEEREKYLAGKTSEIMPKLRLEGNGQPLRLESRWSRVTFPPGEGGLSTVRIAWELHAAWPGSLPAKNFLVWNDANYEDHPGWKEIRFSGLDDLSLAKTSLRARPTSKELDAYPEEYLANPPTDTKAWCLFGPGLAAKDTSGFELPPEFGGPKKRDRLVALLETERLDPKVVILSLLLAVILGALHALEPGHGKTIVGAYLVGSRGTVGQAALLGLVVTFTHTFSVLILGLTVLFLSRHVVPERLLPGLGAISGTLMAAVGLSMLRARWREVRGARAAPHPAHDHGHRNEHEHPHEHDHAHAHDHDHGHDHGRPHRHDHAPGHSHVPEGRATLGSILALGISGGLVPCPAGVVVLLAAVALGRIAFGLVLILAFSVGLAAVLVTIGILFVTARGLFDRAPAGEAWVRRLSLLSAAFVTLFGVALAIRSLVKPGV